MSILPIVKWCVNKNTMALFTRRNLIKSSTVFKLNNDSTIKNGSTVQVGPTTHVVDAFGSFMHTSESPTCRLHGRDIIAQIDMLPGDELTYDPKQTIY
tara:strand:- start:1024 stop:1317 length:294 start_codon:yes stop_codon:yes gene_type:complete